jgi:2-keto-3-deoxy-L-rhamnonate aldolase RhmA
VFIRPIDLSISTGFAPASDLPVYVVGAVAEIAEACARHGIICAAATPGFRNAEAMRECGVDSRTLGSNAGFLRRGGRRCRHAGAGGASA